LDQKIVALKTGLKDMADVLKVQASTVPKINFTIESNLASLIKEFREQNQVFFENNLTLADSIPEFTISSIVSIDSKIVKKHSDASLLKKWISNGTVKFKLIYRGSRDGFTSDVFHKKCDAFKPTLTIVQSSIKDKIFGGFTDLDWTISGNSYKPTEGAFLFSLTEKDKYDLKSGCSQYAICPSTSYLSTFGGGHDFNLCNNCNTSNASYSNFGHSYETKGKAKEILAGAYNFTAKEVEVFHVSYTGELQVKGVKGKKKN